MADTQIGGFPLRPTLDGTEKIVLSSGDADNTRTNLAEVIRQLGATYGLFDYSDSATATTPISFSAIGQTKLTNDTLGVITNRNYPPFGVTDLWDSVNNQFDFTELKLGDRVGFRVDIEVTTDSPNQTVSVLLNVGIGGATPFPLSFVTGRTYKNAGVYRINDIFNILYMGSDNTKNNPAELVIESDGTGTVKVNGWFCEVIQRQGV